MSAFFNPYQMGATVLTVATGAVPVAFSPQQGQIGMRLKILSGGSSGVVFMQGAGSSLINVGYVLGATETIDISGPAKFFLSAFGSTALVSQLISYGAGTSGLP